MKGKFITFEGIEGSGKSEQIKRLKEFLESKGHKVILTREPGGTRIGQEIRKILQHPDNKDITHKAELFFFYTDRHQHIEEKIRPALEQGAIVLCDRHNDSTLAYQHYGRGVDNKLIEHLMTTLGVTPDLTILIDLPVEVGLKRVKKDEFGKADRFEQEAFDFHNNVRNGYLNIAEKEPERVKIVDGNNTKEKVFQDIVKCVDNVLNA